MRWRGGSGGAMTTHTVGPPRAGRQLHSQPPRGSPSGTSSDDGLVMAGTLALPAGNGPHAAVVLLCPGRLDREGDVGKARIGLGRALATALAARGWRPSASTAAASVTRRGTGGRQGSSSIARAPPRCCAHWRPGPRWAPWGDRLQRGRAAPRMAWSARRCRCRRPARLPRTDRTGQDVYMGWAARLGKDEIPWPVRLVLRLLGRTAQGLSGREAWCATSHVTPPGRATTA